MIYMLKMPKTTATAIENLHIFRTIFRDLSILRRDFMVPLVFVKNIQNLCLVIKNMFSLNFSMWYHFQVVISQFPQICVKRFP